MKTIIGIVAFLALTIIPNAEASDIQPYVGVSVGTYSLDFGLGSDNAVGGSALFGVNLHKNFAIETRIGATTKANYNAASTGLDYRVDWMISYLAKPQIPITTDFNVYALLGATTMSTELQARLSGSTVKKTSTNFSYGGGIEYAINNQALLGLEWIQYAKNADINSAVFPGLDVWGASILFKYQF